jgi:hypothetical protein
VRIDHRSPRHSYQLLFGRFRLVIWPIFLKPTPAALTLPRSQFFAPVAVAVAAGGAAWRGGLLSATSHT